MAITRKSLAAMGIEEPKAEEIVASHLETVDGLKEVIENLKKDADKAKSLQEELDEAKAELGKGYEKQFAEMKEKYESMKEKYDKVREDFDTFKSEQAAKDEKVKKTSAYRDLLKETGISDKHMGLVMEVLEGRKKIDEIKLTEDGKVDGADALMESLKKDFGIYIVDEQVRGADTSSPPSNTGSGASGRAREIAARYHENLYGKDKED